MADETIQNAPTPVEDEDSQLDELLDEKGVDAEDIDDDADEPEGGEDEGEDAEEEHEGTAPAAPVAPVTREEVDAVLNLLEISEEELDTPAQRGFQKRDLARLRQENERYRNVVNAMLRGEKRRLSGAAAPTGPQPTAEGEAPPALPDVFEDPEGFARAVAQQAQAPLLKQISELQRVIARSTQDGQINELQRRMIAAERSYEAENPGYYERFSEFARRFHAEQARLGVPQEDVGRVFSGHLQQLVQHALSLRQNPVAVIDREVQRWVGASNLNAATTRRPQRRDAAIDRANAARASSVAGSLSDASGEDDEIDADELVKSDLSDAQVEELFAKGGKEAFFEHMKKSERVAARRARR